MTIPSRTSRTITQQIAEAEDRLARLRIRQRASETRRKIIVGSVTLTEALRSPESAARLATVLRKYVTREIDQKEIAGLLADLDRMAQGAGSGTGRGEA
ncbi:MAG: hypothetical protein ACK47C_04775 [Paracoccaceae bacterium]